MWWHLFPACAGVIRVSGSRLGAARPIPRMRRGDPSSEQEEIEALNYSPHARG